MSGSKQNTLSLIAEENNLELKHYKTLSGGDINAVYLIETTSEKFVVKLNDRKKFPGMFQAEKTGLEALRKPEIFNIPQPISCGEIGTESYLLLEYIPTGKPSGNFWKDFGRKLAELHKNTREYFGFDSDNYIGSLPQYNDKKDSAADFYIEMRLEPQIKMAQDRGYHLPISSAFYKNCRNEIPQEKSSLIHGDLWNGNYLVSEKGQACLIDPATAFAPREMDLGMMKLFGGFTEGLFSEYENYFPLQPGWKDRLDFWQLYYLLVHFNLFGEGYKRQVIQILQKYS
ncbi:fructosamine kinase family protein [Gramella sp. AN32]|uniref:Fructosamine kinase family protein n=1 Tax=Christiangramia antarctica TaxID=2058158 RepID=A0ABW5X1E5_9FLAO|nr:fructosamine kinase family protein [Gramella sp. AN32]MCM4157732.1 fructosamine kinase [Gramella sp. AN32]